MATIVKIDARLARLATRAADLKLLERDVLARAKASTTLGQAMRRTARHERIVARIAKTAEAIKATKVQRKTARA